MSLVLSPRFQRGATWVSYLLTIYMQVACWVGHAGVPAKVKWAPRRMLVASASEVLAFWIPDLNRIAGIGT